MIKTMLVISMLACIVALMSTQACKHGVCESRGMKSNHGNDESHNMGENCMECHSPDGPGEGCFKVAGTVYKEDLSSILTNCVVRLYTEPDGGGELKYSIDGDANGNFYTDETIDFGVGLYPVVISSNGNSASMPSSITTGECNMCHGKNTERINV